MDTKVDRFTETNLALLESLAATAAIAIENAQLYEKAQQDAETKAMLLHEVNHRVKNNLMTISGLFVVETRYTSGEGRAFVVAAMERLNQRLQGLAEVHNMLSQSEWSPVPLADLVNQIVYTALKTLPYEHHIQLKVDQISNQAPIKISPRQASNLALVINELATNTLKYALPAKGGQAKACITVRLALEDDTISFEYRDNGPGYPEAILSIQTQNRYDTAHPQTPGKAAPCVGLYLIQRIVTRTLRGTLALANDGGAVTTMQLKTEERNTT